MKTTHQFTEQEFQVIIKAIEDTLSYSGGWSAKDVLSCRAEYGEASLIVDTFIKNLRRDLTKNKLRY